MVSVETQSETLTELYDLHHAGLLDGLDARWNSVHRLLRQVAVNVVRRRASDLYGEPAEARIEDVFTSILTKFLTCKFPYNGDSIDSLLQTAATRDLMSAFRRSNSVCTHSVHGEERDIEAFDSESRNLFEVVREALPPFRFPEHQFVREAMLAFMLCSGDYPGRRWLRGFGVRQSMQTCIYNAAVVDINRAMVEVAEVAV